MIELIGMPKRFGAVPAVDHIKGNSNSAFFEKYVVPMVCEAKRLGLTLSDAIELIEGGYEE